MTSMMPSQQRFGAPASNRPSQPAQQRQQPSGDMQFAGGTPDFDERTGQTRQPAGQSGGMDMSAYRPGQAQPVQQSFGTAYQSYNTNRSLPQSWPAGPNGGVMTPGGEMWNSQAPRTAPQPAMGGDMMFAGGTPFFDERTGQTRQPPFQMAPAQTPWGQSMDPFAERDAFINQINQQRMQNQIAFNSGGPTNPAAGMTPGIDYRRAMQDAGLGNGAPSMSPNYGDSLIGRLNQQFGGIRHWTDNPRYQQPQFQEPTIPQVVGTTDFSIRSKTPARTPATSLPRTQSAGFRQSQSYAPQRPASRPRVA